MDFGGMITGYLLPDQLYEGVDHPYLVIIRSRFWCYISRYEDGN